MKTNTILKCFLTLWIALPIIAAAQWSPDANENTMVRDTNGWMVVPHVVTCPSGESYISWYSATEGLRFDVYLQRFDVNGNKLWEDNGLMLSDHPTLTWVSDYDLEIDQEDCAVLITQDQRDGHGNAFAYRISPDGDFLWGPDGINITNNSEGNFGPQVMTTADNSMIFLYPNYPEDTMQISTLGVQKRDNSGNLLWQVNLEQDSLDYFTPQMLMTEDGNLVVSWLYCYNPSTIIPGQERWIHIRMQMFNPDGQALWPEPVQPDTGNALYYAGGNYIPFLENDGNGGAYIIWQSYNMEGNPTVRANRVNAGGQLLWPENGIQVSSRLGYQQFDPMPYYNPTSDNLFVFWTEYHLEAATACSGVGGQKFSTDGILLWGDEAKILVPMICANDSACFFSEIGRGSSDGICLFYEKEYIEINGPDTSIQDEIYACLVDVDGNTVWAGDKVAIALAESEKGHFVAGDFVQGQWISAWEDNRMNPSEEWNTGVYAQNITLDGNLGPLAIPESLPDIQPRVKSYPNPFSEIITVEYQINNPGDVIILIKDIQGRTIQTFSAGYQVNGKHSLEVGAGHLRSGLYFLEVKSGSTSQTVKILKSNSRF
jgi:hypothetical protein